MPCSRLDRIQVQVLATWEWESVSHPPHFGMCPDVRAPADASLPQKLRVTLYYLRSGVGGFGANMLRWDIRDNDIGGVNLRGLALGQHSFEETSLRWRVVGDNVFNFTGLGMKPQTSAPIASTLTIM